MHVNQLLHVALSELHPFIFLILTVVCICLYGTFESGNTCKRTTKTKTFFPYLVIFVLDLPDV